MLKKIIYLSCLLAILFACSTPNDPYIGGEESIYFVYDKTFFIIGNPIYIDVSTEYLFVAEDQVGFSFYNQQSGELYKRIPEFTYLNSALEESIQQLRSTFLTKFIPEKNLLFVADKTTNGLSRLYSFNINDPNSTSTEIKNMSFFSLLNDFSYEYNAVEDLIYLYWCSYSDDGSNIYKVQLKTHDINFGIWDPPLMSIAENRIHNETYGVFSNDTHFFASMGQWGVVIITRDLDLTEVAIAETSGEAIDVAVKDNYLYVACKQAGLQVVDISNISDPVVVSVKETTGYASSISIYENYLALASTSGGVYIYDISTPNEPQFLERMLMKTVGYVNRVIFNDGDLFIASRDKGVIKYKLK